MLQIYSENVTTQPRNPNPITYDPKSLTVYPENLTTQPKNPNPVNRDPKTSIVYPENVIVQPKNTNPKYHNPESPPMYPKHITTQLPDPTQQHNPNLVNCNPENIIDSNQYLSDKSDISKSPYELRRSNQKRTKTKLLSYNKLRGKAINKTC